MNLSRRNFLTTASLGILGQSYGTAANLFKSNRLYLDLQFINSIRSRIEHAILPAMEQIYLTDQKDLTLYRPELKYIEKVVGFYDYQACGISVLAILALKGNERARKLIRKILDNSHYYADNIYGKEIDGNQWETPLRRVLLHLALAYQTLLPILKEEEKKEIKELVEQQIPLALKWNKNFYPGQGNLYMNTNNHTAIFMQGIYHCGKIFNHPEWSEVTLDFARRMYDSVNPDGYFEEASNKEREAGPSLVYTRLSLGCLYDVLNGKELAQEKFIKAGGFYRSFINADYEMIPLADERTNSTGKGINFGLALHSLTLKGRHFIADNLKDENFRDFTIETMAVIYYELSLMQLGDCQVPENRVEGNSRLALPLGIVRKKGYTAGLSALAALNRTLHPNNDYHLDRQNMVYLSHDKAGVILTGYKSKRNPDFSTFRINEDAYTIKTGDLEMGNGWAEATLYYRSFTAKIRWELSDSPRLILSTDSDQKVVSSFPITNEKYIKTDQKYGIRLLDGFSPYTEGNREGKIKAAVFEWERQLVLDFKI